ncbi:CLUMA_CG011703, isoform A [Clunio marinus]|uniref:CLUMA_CG011703, isoform A n=1 Tax=Clunio marinus TaxID=568069 RepID=A0A1J1IDJ7_9DIPT|nr:CLUMA_CG011703, isoform A [Clunio marinus]
MQHLSTANSIVLTPKFNLQNHFPCLSTSKQIHVNLINLKRVVSSLLRKNVYADKLVRYVWRFDSKHKNT